MVSDFVKYVKINAPEVCIKRYCVVWYHHINLYLLSNVTELTYLRTFLRHYHTERIQKLSQNT
jgi:hypothetical protein